MPMYDGLCITHVLTCHMCTHAFALCFPVCVWVCTHGYFYICGGFVCNIVMYWFCSSSLLPPAPLYLPSSPGYLLYPLSATLQDICLPEFWLFTTPKNIHHPTILLPFPAFLSLISSLFVVVGPRTTLLLLPWVQEEPGHLCTRAQASRGCKS